MKNVVWGLVLLLVVLHQDVWFWEDDTLVFGFLPIALLYHAMISIAAACTWWLATKYAWPVEDDGAPAPAADETGEAGT